MVPISTPELRCANSRLPHRHEDWLHISESVLVLLTSCPTANFASSWVSVSPTSYCSLNLAIVALLSLSPSLCVFISCSSLSLLSWSGQVCLPCKSATCSVYSGIFQMPLAALSPTSKIKTVSSAILWSCQVASLYRYLALQWLLQRDTGLE